MSVDDIDAMPRGGPDASWLDRRLQTGCAEYLDRDDVDERIKRSVVRTLEWTGDVFKHHERFAYLALEEIADVPDPKILELGAGHGGLSRKLLEQHPTARVTVTDIDATSVLNIAASELGSHPRATVQVADATEIDAPGRVFRPRGDGVDVPPPVARAGCPGDRRGHPGGRQASDHRPAAAAVAAAHCEIGDVPAVLWSIPFVHDGFISSLRAYSPSALRALAAHAGPRITVELRKERWARRC